MPLVLPCHRVIGMDGKLHGYGLAEGVDQGMVIENGRGRYCMKIDPAMDESSQVYFHDRLT